MIIYLACLFVASRGGAATLSDFILYAALVEMMVEAGCCLDGLGRRLWP